MAYVIPVAVLLVDHAAAAALINEPPNYFDDYRNDRYDGLERLQKVTKAPINSFSSEDESVYYLGLYVESDWCIRIDNALLAKASNVRAQHEHPLIKSASLAVVSQFN